jgi:hypothetical protein
MRKTLPDVRQAGVAVAWRPEGAGALTFLTLTVLYMLMASSRVDWTVVIAGPLLITGLLFLWNWARE